MSKQVMHGHGVVHQGQIVPEHWSRVRTARRYRTIEIQVGEQTITAEEPLPDDLAAALNAIHRVRVAH